MLPYARIEHGEFFRNRASERELCQDFPGDKILIDGLHSMQVHLWSNGLNIDIPVVKVMNAAHYLAAYMFRTTCSGDQTEYDTLAYCSVGHDKRLMLISIIVLAAMMQRTEGLRAGQCRDILIENRNEDFVEGVTLYDRFLKSAEKRFAEEDFLTDIPAVIDQMKEKDALINRQAQQIQQLQYTVTTMEKQQNNQYNNCVIYQAPVYNTTTTNNYYTPAAAPGQSQEHRPPQNEKEQANVEDITPVETSETLFCRITQAAYDKGKAQQVEAELKSACTSAPKLVKAIRTNEALGYLDTKNLSSVELYNLLNKHFGLTFKVRTFQDYRSK